MVCGSYAAGRTGLSGSFRRGVREGIVDGIHVIELELPYSNKDGFLKRIGTFLKFACRSTWLGLSREYDLLFATTTPLTAGIPGIVAKLLRRKKFVFEVRDLWPELPKAMGVIRNPVVLTLMSMLEWSSYHAADACIGLSPGIVEGIHRRGIPMERIVMVPNGCDLGIFDQHSVVAHRPEGVEAGHLMAVFAGTHGAANGLGAVLDAAAVLKSRGAENIKLVFVGDGKEKPALTERANREGLTNCLFHEPVSKTELASLMAAADVGLMVLANIPAFYYGTSPNKFFDYISSGLPVLNNYPGWLADYIDESRCGVAVPPDDATAFADALMRMAEDREELREMGVRGRVLATQFDRERLSNQFADWLEKTACV
ncbi:glycosyltransferase WbuB [Pandoraea cepalis]|uniref:Glycosyltransferase WbuB n=1 Tax=Pandoraea cepalis TaxID=2508294 RepID=A0A5E4XFA0_9BURK|nr:glycosyltransferase WbuB [Pandoraea cepalis]